MSESATPPIARAGMTIALGAESSITIKATSTDTSGAYALMEYVAGPGAGSGFHTHRREDEAFYVLSGTLQFVLDHDTFIAQPGDYVHIPKGTRHAFQNPSDQRTTALIIVSPGGLEQFFVDLATIIADGQPDPAAIAQLAERYQLAFE